MALMQDRKPLALGDRVKVLWPVRLNNPIGEIIGILNDGSRYVVKFSETDSVTTLGIYVRPAS